MLVPLAETAVNGDVINLAGAIVAIGGLVLTYAWLQELYLD
ncbi:hypothetical protein [Halapricum hydrolyticum]|uniref:Uncharacterized protein n=1 Tax=Halapricum hydrolyticum TaxID=2979991 RepID=A0AAE3ICF8_9EURY|nr:hypothetical protein [Halapricum hydrolyticum]MCU4716525.1 hypothetical protein [Halapricum hydrolyticum]MCU4725870.1 hypothetical protein [Halapricum hydrolyticum]